MFNSPIFKPVIPGQKVAPNQREAQPGKPLTVVWEKQQATVGETVHVFGTANFKIANALRIAVNINFNGAPIAQAKNVSVKGSQIFAQWEVQPFQKGNFTAGSYEAEIKYERISAKTDAHLRIVDPTKSGDGFDSLLRSR